VFFMSLFGCSPGAMPEWMKGTGQRLVDELPVFIHFDLKVWCKNISRKYYSSSEILQIFYKSNKYEMQNEAYHLHSLNMETSQ